MKRKPPVSLLEDELQLSDPVIVSNQVASTSCIVSKSPLIPCDLAEEFLVLACHVIEAAISNDKSVHEDELHEVSQ